MSHNETGKLVYYMVFTYLQSEIACSEKMGSPCFLQANCKTLFWSLKRVIKNSSLGHLWD